MKNWQACVTRTVVARVLRLGGGSLSSHRSNCSFLFAVHSLNPFIRPAGVFLILFLLEKRPFRFLVYRSVGVDGLSLRCTTGSEQLSLSSDELKSSSSAQEAFAVASPRTKNNGGSFGAGCSRSKLKWRRRHEQDDRVTCVNPYERLRNFCLLLTWLKGPQDTPYKLLIFRILIICLKNSGKKNLLRIRKAMFVFVLLREPFKARAILVPRMHAARKYYMESS